MHTNVYPAFFQLGIFGPEYIYMMNEEGSKFVKNKKV